MLNNLFDYVTKIIGFFKKPYVIFMITLVIFHFTLNVNQNEFSEYLDCLFKNDIMNAKLLSLLDNIFFNCAFFSLNISVICFTLKMLYRSDGEQSIQSKDYQTFSAALNEFRQYFKISIAVLYLVHIMLNYKLFITDFLFSFYTMLSKYHWSFLNLSVPIFIICVILNIIKIKLSKL